MSDEMQAALWGSLLGGFFTILGGFLANLQSSKHQQKAKVSDQKLDDELAMKVFPIVLDNIMKIRSSNVPEEQRNSDLIQLFQCSTPVVLKSSNHDLVYEFIRLQQVCRAGFASKGMPSIQNLEAAINAINDRFFPES